MDTFNKTLSKSSVLVAKRLLGSLLVRELGGGQIISGRIVETEAYSQIDAASHSFKGKTARTEVMFGPSGFAYVYFTYGMHYCLNVVTGDVGQGEAVLLRALEPVQGIELMTLKRGPRGYSNLTNGPAKFCQALDINKHLNGHDLRTSPLLLKLAPKLPDKSIVQTTRIGISKDINRQWRFYIKDNPWVSKK